MRRYAFTVLCLTVMLILYITAVYASAALTITPTSLIPLTPVPAIVKSGQNINVRSGLGTDYETITILSLNTTVTVIARTETWYLLQVAGGTEGWIRADLLELLIPTPTPDATLSALPLTPVEHNVDWIPIIREIDGAEMVLVTWGCFNIGIAEEQLNFMVDEFDMSPTQFDFERPDNRRCFNPFWIDRYEVTNAQFTTLGGTAAHSGHWVDDNRPRENVNWFEAKDFCELRGSRLPTESEWEYAARGPDSLIFPWGNDFMPDNLVSMENAGDQTAEVGSRPEGVTWVGALDMIGNLWEWTSSLAYPYPYFARDGREDQSDTSGYRILRGSGWSGRTWNEGVSRYRATLRYEINPNAIGHTIGFRCARDY